MARLDYPDVYGIVIHDGGNDPPDRKDRPMFDTDTPDASFTIQWDMGDYPGFVTYADARAFQREHGMTGSSIVRADEAR